MSQYVSQMNMRSATGRKNKFDLSHTHVSTSDFGVMQPVTCFEMVPGDDFKLKIDHFVRLMPMPAPTFGSVQCRLRAFFVPYRCVMPDFNDFISRNFVARNIDSWETPVVPRISFSRVIEAFFGTNGVSSGTSFCTFLSAGSAPASPVPSADFIVYANLTTSSGNVTGYTWRAYNFTPAGRRAWQLLQSLGYNFPNMGEVSSLSAASYSALPLLAWWKAYLDWVVPSRFAHNYTRIFNMLYGTFASSGRSLTAGEIALLLTPTYGYYPADYFTSAFINPNGTESSLNLDFTSVIPGTHLSSGSEQRVISNNGSATDSPELASAPEGASLALSPNDGDDLEFPNTVFLSQYSLMTLGRLQSLINRGKLAGTKVQDFFVEAYGLRPSDAALKLSSYLGSSANLISIGDVMSMAGTDQNALGQFAGRGVGGNSSSFSYETKEHGMLFVSYELVTKASYVQGMNPACERVSLNDFFVPEFDNVGLDAIPSTAFASGFMKPIEIGKPATYRSRTTFGFTPRFSNYKYKNDMLTGDFRLNSLNATLEPWYLARRFEGQDVALWRSINENFCKCTTDSPLQDLDYIFNANTNASDHFYFIFDINCMAMRPMITLAEALDIEDDNKMGKNVSIKTAD